MALEFPTRILVATDGSPASQEALVTACQLAQATRSDLHLGFVALTSSTIRGRPMTPRQREVLEEEGSRVLDDAARRAREGGCEATTEHVRFGSRVDIALIQLQEDLDAGLLVIGTRPGGSLARRLFGEEGGTEVTRRAPRSVLLVRTGS
jgi:universal stress protein A